MTEKRANKRSVYNGRCCPPAAPTLNIGLALAVSLRASQAPSCLRSARAAFPWPVGTTWGRQPAAAAEILTWDQGAGDRRDKLWIPVNRWSTRVTTARGKHGCQQTGRRRASRPNPPISTCEAQAPCWAGTHLPFPVRQAPPSHAGSPAPPTREAPLPECCGDGSSSHLDISLHVGSTDEPLRSVTRTLSLTELQTGSPPFHRAALWSLVPNLPEESQRGSC